MNRLSDSHPSLNDILKFCTSRNAALHQLQMFERWQDCIKLREFLLVRINFTEIQVSSYIGPHDRADFVQYSIKMHQTNTFSQGVF